ncbi:MAG: DUF3368 domain-containing protein [Candidatus Helarchaeota archaeon]
MIIDSTVILSLGLIGKLELIQDIEIPKRVFDEIQTESIKKKLNEQKFKIITPTKKSRLKALEILGDTSETGDSDIVASLFDLPNSIIATDDKRIRSVCRILGGKITGTLGILIHSVKNNKLSKSEAFEILKKLHSTGFRMSLELYEEVRNKISRLP